MVHLNDFLYFHSTHLQAITVLFFIPIGIIWSRFKEVMRLNTQSVKDADPLKMKTVDQRPHYVRRPNGKMKNRARFHFLVFFINAYHQKVKMNL